MHATGPRAGREPARGPHVLRQINLSAVLDAARERPSARLADLMQATGLSRPAVTRAVAQLRDAGLLVDLPQPADRGGVQPGEPQSLGRPAQQVRFRAEVGHVAAVDVGSHKVLAKVADLAGAVVASRQVAVPEPTSGAGLLAAVQDALKGALLDARLVPDDVWAIAVGAPGIVDQARGEVLLAPSIPGWAHVSVPQALQTTFSCPVLVDNDTNLAVLGERWRGAAAGSDSLVFVHWGARIGVGVVIDGRPYRGGHAAAGELGFVDIFSGPDEPGGRRRLGAAGSLGPFERQVGAEAILALTRERLGARGARRLVREAGPADAVAGVFAAAAAGDPQALDVVDTVARRFARGLAVLLVLLDPSEVVIGGGVSQAGETLLVAIERHLRPRVLAWPRLVLSSLGGDAVAVGGIRRALDHVEPRLHQDTAAV